MWWVISYFCYIILANLHNKLLNWALSSFREKKNGGQEICVQVNTCSKLQAQELHHDSSFLTIFNKLVFLNTKEHKGSAELLGVSEHQRIIHANNMISEEQFCKIKI